MSGREVHHHRSAGNTMIPREPKGAPHLSAASEQERKKDPKGGKVNDILAAALEEFFQQGFAAARLDAIAERAGIAKGTIYLYFDSKEALFEGAVRSIVGPVFAQLDSFAAAPQGSAADMLRAMLRTFYH